MTSHATDERLTVGPLARPAGVTVIMPARNAADTLEPAVRSALAQAIEGPLEVVVAVAPSTDATATVAGRLAADPRVKLVHNPAATTPSGLNRALAVSTQPVIVRLDAHAQLPDGYVQHAIDLLAETGAANVGGRQIAVADRGFARAVAIAMASPLGAGGARYRQGGEPGDVETVYLGVFRRDALVAVGGFDERLVRNQDYELNHRLRSAGGRVYFHPDLGVAYSPRASITALWHQYFDYGRWKRTVIAIHPSSLRVRQLAAPVLVAGLLLSGGLAIWRRTWSPVLVPGGAYLAAIGLGAVVTARPRRLAVPTALAVVVMHLAWGTGFLFGRRPTLAPGPSASSGAPDR